MKKSTHSFLTITSASFPKITLVTTTEQFRRHYNNVIES